MTLLQDRAAILAGLDGAGARTSTTLKLAAPVVLVEPGDPWSEPVRMPGRLTRWRLTAIAGKVDTEGAIATLAELVDLVDAGLRQVDGCQLPTWARPADYLIDGVPYAASVATVSIASS